MADYNGWTNYETWAVNLWLSNELASQERVGEMARDAWREASDGRVDVFTPSERARLLLRDSLQDEHENVVSELIRPSVFSDLLYAALGRVVWIEIADHWLADAQLPGYEARK